MSRSVGWHDAAELAAVAWELGASHAPGSPLHSLSGFLLGRLAGEASTGTTALSVIASSLSAGLLAALVAFITRDRLLAVSAALVYAFSFQVWAAAVATEVYAPSMLFLALAFLFAWLWYSNGRSVHLAFMLAAYMLALGAYFANVLLLPAFLYLVWTRSQRPVADTSLLLATFGVGVVLVGIANYLTMRNLAPFGEIVPDSLGSMFLYMSGSQHEPLQVRSAGFLTARITEHAGIFTRSVFYLGLPLGLAGCWQLLQLYRAYAVFLLLVFSIYTLYYTVFGPGDYFMMVLPVYFVFAVWIGAGTAWLAGSFGRAYLVAGVRLLPALLVLILLAVQFNGRRAMAAVTDAEEFAAEAAAVLPSKALVIAGWREFAVLNYFQIVHGDNPGHHYLLPARTVRNYPYGAVKDYLDKVAAEICALPVYTFKKLPELEERYRVAEVPGGSGWMLLAAPPDAACVNKGAPDGD